MRTQYHTNNECHSNDGDIVDQKNNNVTDHDLGETEDRYYIDDQADFDHINESLETNNQIGVDRTSPIAHLQMNPFHINSNTIAYSYLQLPRVINQVNYFYATTRDYSLNLPNPNVNPPCYPGESGFFHRRETNNDSNDTDLINMSHTTVESYYNISPST